VEETADLLADLFRMGLPPVEKEVAL